MTYETAIETLHEFIQEVERQNEMQGEGFDFYMPQTRVRSVGGS